jgi:hypothetical protein
LEGKKEESKRKKKTKTKVEKKWICADIKFFGRHLFEDISRYVFMYCLPPATSVFSLTCNGMLY